MIPVISVIKSLFQKKKKKKTKKKRKKKKTGGGPSTMEIDFIEGKKKE